MTQITINLPDGEKKSWTTCQLVTVMCAIDSLYSTHIEDIKAEARERVGLDGGKLVWKEHHINVARQGEASESTKWKELALSLLEDREDREKLIADFSERKDPPKQRVTCKQRIWAGWYSWSAL